MSTRDSVAHTVAGAKPPPVLSATRQSSMRGWSTFCTLITMSSSPSPFTSASTQRPKRLYTSTSCWAGGIISAVPSGVSPLGWLVQVKVVNGLHCFSATGPAHSCAVRSRLRFVRPWP
jgi:hypothetical protein